MIWWVALKALLGSVQTKYWLYAGAAVAVVAAALLAEQHFRSQGRDAALEQVREGNRDAREKGLDTREKALRDYDDCMLHGGVWDRARLLCHQNGPR